MYGGVGGEKSRDFPLSRLSARIGVVRCDFRQAANLFFTSSLIRFFSPKRAKLEKTIACCTYSTRLAENLATADVSPLFPFMTGSDEMTRIRIRNRGRKRVSPARIEGD
jgi:hypothetical protein